MDWASAELPALALASEMALAMAVEASLRPDPEGFGQLF